MTEQEEKVIKKYEEFEGERIQVQEELRKVKIKINETVIKQMRALLCNNWDDVDTYAGEKIELLEQYKVLKALNKAILKNMNKVHTAICVLASVEQNQ